MTESACLPITYTNDSIVKQNTCTYHPNVPAFTQGSENEILCQKFSLLEVYRHRVEEQLRNFHGENWLSCLTKET